MVMLWGNVGGVNIPYILIEVFTPINHGENNQTDIKMKVKKHFNLDKQIKKAFAKVAEGYDYANQDVISNPRNWGEGFGTTYRKSGEVVSGGNRNIVDLANLRNSQKMEIVDLTATYSWSGNGKTPVVLQYFGWTSSKGNRVPARPWAEVAANEFDFVDTFSMNFKR